MALQEITTMPAAPTTSSESPLYPFSQPYKSEMFPVSQLHTLSIRQYGDPHGTPVCMVHGGPGGGCDDDKDSRRFDPERYRIVLFDQRGSGLSTPPSELRENTTWDLVSDMEKIRENLQIEKWHIFGGSWGSTLALAYAQEHPDKVKSLTLRGIFTLRKKELDFFYQGPGTSFIFPEYWAEYIAVIPEDERHDMVSAYYKRLTGTDEKVRAEAGRAWSRWEMATSRLQIDPAYLARADGAGFADAFARIESHYFVNKGFFKEDGQLLKKENIEKIRHIPAVIVQGRFDMVCPITTAWELSQLWPEAKYVVVPDAGHSAIESGIEKALVEATNEFASLA